MQAPNSPLTTPSLPCFITTGDFNNDGKKDLAVGYFDAVSYITIYLGNGNGTFGTGTNFTVTGSYPNSIAVGDFNMDGKQDLVVACQGSNNISILIGDGAGGFAPQVSYYSGSMPYSVAISDFNNDGKQDLVVTDWGGMRLTIFQGNGSGGFSNAGTLFSTATSLGNENPCNVRTVDVNGDGNQDILYTAKLSGSMHVYFGNGTMGFNGAFICTPVTTNLYEDNPLAIGDFNEDGKMDIAKTNQNENYLSLLLNAGISSQGTGNFNPPQNVLLGTTQNTCISVGDFNSDNHLDLVTTDQATNNINILTGSGNGSFAASVSFNVGSGSNWVAVSDFNGDGFSDLAIANQNNKKITILLNAMPKITISSLSVCIGNSANLAASIIGADTYTNLWSTGATTSSLAVAPTASTTYTLTATNSTGQCSATNTVQVIVNPLPILSVNNLSICSGTPGTLNASGAYTYVWSPATSLSSNTGNSVSANPNSNTTYTITGTSSLGCVNKTTTTVTVNPLPSITVTNPSYCVGGSGLLIPTAAGVSSYSWSPSTNLNHTTGSVITSATSSTTYTVTGTDIHGCKSTAVSSVTVNSLPVIAVNNPNVCYNTASSLVATGASTYTWSPATGLSSSYGSPVTANLASNATYTISGTNANGCINKTVITVTVNPMPSAFTVNSTTVCGGSSTTLSVYTGGGVNPNNVTTASARNSDQNEVSSSTSTYVWSPATGLSTTTGTSVTAHPSATTVYTITATNSSGCTYSTTATVTVIVNDQSNTLVSFNLNVINTSATTVEFQVTCNMPPTLRDSWLIQAYNCSTGATIPNTQYSIIYTSNPSPGYNGHPPLNFPGYTSVPNTTMDPNGITPAIGQVYTFPGGQTFYEVGHGVWFPNTCPQTYFASSISTGCYFRLEDTTNTTKTTTGINTITIKNNINAFPNPTIGILTIQSLDDGELGEITIYNLLGELVYQNKSTNTTEQIDVSNLSSGVYTLLAQSSRIKFIKD